MAWTTSDIPPLAARVAVVTGANGGLGMETALALARAGAEVMMTARNVEKAQSAERHIRRLVPDASLTIVALDLASLASVRTAADKILAKHDRIDILVNNAGVMGIPEQQTADGFEMQFGVNHLGHFALTSHLLPALLRAEAARIVSVTSTAHHMGRAVDPKNPHLHGNYTPWRAYGQSKLANFHFGIGLHRMLSNAGARASSLIAHPGLSNTDLQTTSVEQTDGGQSQRFWQAMAVRSGTSPAQGALPQLRAATDSHAMSGQLFAPRFINSGAPVRRPIFRRIGLEGGIRKLWEVSERETGVTIDVETLMTGRQFRPGASE